MFDKNITATSVITVTKANPAHYGVPDTFLSDNGAQYVSHEFLKLVTGSLYYVKATGKAEPAVKGAVSWKIA